MHVDFILAETVYLHILRMKRIIYEKQSISLDSADVRNTSYEYRMSVNAVV